MTAHDGHRRSAGTVGLPKLERVFGSRLGSGLEVRGRQTPRRLPLASARLPPEGDRADGTPTSSVGALLSAEGLGLQTLSGKPPKSCTTGRRARLTRAARPLHGSDVSRPAWRPSGGSRRTAPMIRKCTAAAPSPPSPRTFKSGSHRSQRWAARVAHDEETSGQLRNTAPRRLPVRKDESRAALGERRWSAVNGRVC